MRRRRLGGRASCVVVTFAINARCRTTSPHLLSERSIARPFGDSAIPARRSIARCAPSGRQLLSALRTARPSGDSALSAAPICAAAADSSAARARHAFSAALSPLFRSAIADRLRRAHCAPSGRQLFIALRIARPVGETMAVIFRC